MKYPQILLLIDDTVIVFLIALIGIRYHQTDPDIFTRLPYTFFPFLAAWVLFSRFLQLYDPTVAADWKQIWRVIAAAAFAAPAGAAIRALWLNTPLVPIFAFIMGAALGLGLLISRSLFILAFGHRWAKRTNG